MGAGGEISCRWLRVGGVDGEVFHCEIIWGISYDTECELINDQCAISCVEWKGLLMVVIDAVIVKEPMTTVSDRGTSTTPQFSTPCLRLIKFWPSPR